MIPNSREFKSCLDKGAEYYAPSDNADEAVMALDHWWINNYVLGPEVAELGCSDGTSTRMLLGHAQSVQVVEGSSLYCKMLHENLSSSRLRVANCLFEEFVPDRSYDDIVFARSLDYVISPVDVLKRVVTWLAPGGRLHVVVPNAASLHRRIGLAMGMMNAIDALTPHLSEMGHARMYTKETLTADLLAAGLDISVFRGFFLKPFDYASMEAMDSNWVTRLLPALQEVSKTVPDDLCCSFYVLCRPVVEG